MSLEGGFEPRRRVESIAVVAVGGGDMRRLAVVEEAGGVGFPIVFCAVFADAAAPPEGKNIAFSAVSYLCVTGCRLM